MSDIFSCLREYWEKYRIEALLIAVALAITVASTIIYINSNRVNMETIAPGITPAPNSTRRTDKILIDISGAVKKPGVYEVTIGARLKDVIGLAGGLADEADRGFFLRNYNLARFVNDQEKIYVPAAWEINSGLFQENQRILDYSQPVTLNLAEAVTTQSQLISPVPEKININQASLEDLDVLPGIGQVTAGKIVKSRPYATLEDLINKKVIGKSVFDNIKDLIVL